MGAIIVMDELVKSFKTIALMGKPRRDINLQMHKNLYQWLKERGYQVLVEKEVGELLPFIHKDLVFKKC